MRAPGNSVGYKAMDACCRQHDSEYAEGTESNGRGTAWEKRESQHLLKPARAIKRQLRIKLRNRAANFADYLRRRKRRLHLERRTVVILQDRQKQRGLLGFGETLVLAVLDDTNDFNKMSKRVGGEPLADYVLAVKNPLRECKIHDGDFR